MDIVALKGILLAVMSAITIIFGLIPMKVMKTLSGKTGAFEQRASFIVSLLSCFAGGVFLGVCFLDLLPDAMESFEGWKESAGFKSDYPFVPLMFMIGFYAVSILEEIIGRFCGHEKDGKLDQRRKHAATFVSTTSSIEDGCLETESINSKVAIVKSLTFVLALMFHASLEGFAFGVQQSTISVASLFFGIIVHKAVVSFSVGMRLAEAHPHRPAVVVALVALVALVTPLGGVIGILIEILVPEYAKDHNKFFQWLSSVIGFAIIAGMMVFES
ncbi:metal cation transporter, ZIP family [Necator americanus]|uniref:Metal cation transporter, ZIP family n=1 Tax=Necator americanus TaxID=51031 RepID=W2TPN3_NECAM|nr:metal cation transporter, ZIP family [Necator americanus]ETN83733.1 metal cation transporter, ZIP family [Necator americanus]